MLQSLYCTWLSRRASLAQDIGNPNDSRSNIIPQEKCDPVISAQTRPIKFWERNLRYKREEDSCPKSAQKLHFNTMIPLERILCDRISLNSLRIK